MRIAINDAKFAHLLRNPHVLISALLTGFRFPFSARRAQKTEIATCGTIFYTFSASRRREKTPFAVCARDNANQRRAEERAKSKSRGEQRKGMQLLGAERNRISIDAIAAANRTRQTQAGLGVSLAFSRDFVENVEIGRFR